MGDLGPWGPTWGSWQAILGSSWCPLRLSFSGPIPAADQALSRGSKLACRGAPERFNSVSSLSWALIVTTWGALRASGLPRGLRGPHPGILALSRGFSGALLP
eukprot:3919710-Pyramimonas_sp.AAC.1